MSTPNTDTQLATLRTRLGESSDTSQARFSTAQLLGQLNASRNEVAEQTWCYPVKDEIAFTVSGSIVAPVSQALPTSGDPFLITTTNSFIWMSSLTWNGRPLLVSRPEDWEDKVGDDDTLTGEPIRFMYFGRQIQIFRVPDTAGTLQYRARAYPDALVSGGVDTSFLERSADVANWHAAMVLKGSDERSNVHEEKMMARGILELKLQYRPRGPRGVKSFEPFPTSRPII